MTSFFPPSIGATHIRLLIPEASHRTPVFSKGEILEGSVLKSMRGDCVLLKLGEHTVMAHSRVPLREGMSISLRVEEVAPHTILQIVSDIPQETKTIARYIALHRSNPRSLPETLTSLSRTIMDLREMESLPREVRPLLDQAGYLTESLILSQSSLKNPEFLKNYILHLGISLEHAILHHAEKKQRREDMRHLEGLKGKLIQLSKVIENTIEYVNSADFELIEHLVKLQHYATQTIQSIETQQVLNVVSYEAGDPFILLLPLLFPGGIRLQELYICPPEREEGETTPVNISRRVVFFLDMDTLGEIMVEVRMRGLRVGCHITCHNEAGQKAIEDELGYLKNRFLAAGFEIDAISCSIDPRIGKKMRSFRSTLTINKHEIMSVFV